MLQRFFVTSARVVGAAVLVVLVCSARTQAVAVSANGQVGVVSTGVPSVAAQSSATVPATDANAGAALVQANGCIGCHGATFRGGIGPALYGIEHRLSPTQIAQQVKTPTAPMPDFGFTQPQIDDIVAYLSALDGGATGNAPVVAFQPPSPTTGDTTISITFHGTPPHSVSVSPEMHMGNMKMQTQITTLQPSPQDAHVFTGTIHFSMGGPWTVHVLYDGQSLDIPLTVGS